MSTATTAARVDAIQVSVCLPGAHEHNGLPAEVDHGDGRVNLVINYVKLGKHYSDFPTSLTPQNVITYGFLFYLESNTSLRISILLLGVSIFIKD